MADPFEVRMRFTNHLAHLSASTTSSLKAAAYALKYRDMDEDLHSCIIENLERGSAANGGGTQPGAGAERGATSRERGDAVNSNTGSGSATSAAPAPIIVGGAALMNNRANIMYFLESFCEMASRPGNEGHMPYVDMVRRDILRIVDCVATSGANVKVVRRVVGNLEGKGVLSADAVKGVEDNLKIKERERGNLLAVVGDDETERDVEGAAGSRNEDSMDHNGEGGSIGRWHGDMETVAAEKRSTEKDGKQTRSAPRTGTGAATGSSQKDSKMNGAGVSKADKRAIEQRIEEDRERNKRLREGVWAVNGDNDDFELEKMWEEGSEVSEGDYVIAGEEAEERRQFARYHRSLLER